MSHRSSGDGGVLAALYNQIYALSWNVTVVPDALTPSLSGIYTFVRDWVFQSGENFLYRHHQVWLIGNNVSSDMAYGYSQPACTQWVPTDDWVLWDGEDITVAAVPYNETPQSKAFLYNHYNCCDEEQTMAICSQWIREYTRDSC